MQQSSNNTMEDTAGKLSTDVKLLLRLIEHDEGERREWADTQVEAHDLRHNGLQRNNVEPWQSNLPYMHTDAAIENIKPQYVGHVYNSELLADFTSVDEETDPATVTLRAMWFDRQMRNYSNFDKEILAAIDIFLQSGFSYMRVIYNTDDEKLEFKALRPLDVVVPWGTRDLSKATRIAVKLPMTPVEYALDSRFEVTDSESIRKMIGIKSQEQQDIDDQKEYDYGFQENAGKIEIWEVYVRDRDGWVLHTINKNIKDKPLRSPVRLPYLFQGKPFAPIVHFPFEIIDLAGVYDSRGLPQKLAHDEAELTSLRCQMLDAVKIAGTPVFENAQGLGNSNNFKFKPLGVLPAGLTQKTIQFPNVDFQIAENNILARSERRITSPDYGVRQMSEGSDRRTAYEVQSINSLTMQSTNLRFKVLRIALTELYRYADAILCFHRSDDEKLLVDGRMVTIPADTKTREYEIIPAGAEELWNKERRTQQAREVWQQFNGQPWFDSEGWAKYTLTTISPRFAQKYIIPTNIKSQHERTKQLQENLLLERGEMVPISQADDHATHALTTYEAIAKAAAQGVSFSPQASQAFIAHLQQHIETLKQINPQAAKQVEGQIEQLKQVVMQQVQQQQQMAMQQQQAAPALADNLPQ